MDTDNSLTDRGLQRRLKRHFLKQQHDFFAITTPGFEHVLKSELQLFDGVEICETTNGGVQFSGPLDLIYKSNLHLRTANRVLMRIESFTARSYPELYNKCRRIPWELYCGFSNAVSFSVSSKNSRLHHSQNIENAIFDALHDYMEKLGVKVTSSDASDICFYVRFAEDQCSLSIDSSGDLLYKRGYRLMTALAPLRETIASAVLMEAQWKRFQIIMDPMCGSGVFLLEAASMALCKVPGANRKFAFFSWPSFDSGKWQRLKEMALTDELTHVDTTLLASDISDEALKSASENAVMLGVQEFIRFSKQDCLTITPVNGPGLLISNLPYGKRVGFKDDGLLNFFKQFGRHIKEQFGGWSYVFIVADQEFEKIAHLSVQKVISFNNGGIPVRLLTGKL